MIILAFETLGDGVSVAVSTPEGRVVERRASTRRQDEKLIPVMDAALKAAGVSLDRVGLIAVASGPGRFTSARVGVTFANLLAGSLGVKISAVTLFEAFAARLLSESCPPGALRLAIPAFNGEGYVQDFQIGKTNFKPLGKPEWVPVLGEAQLPLIPLRARAVLAAASALEKRRAKAAEPLYLKPANYTRK